MKKIVLIDDEPEILSLLEYLFSQVLRFEVFTFSDVIPLHTVAELSPDVIILDYRLGNNLGSDFCKAIKATPGTSHIPVVMLSADENLPEIAQTSCADDFLTKPFDVEKLSRTVKNVMLPAAS